MLTDYFEYKQAYVTSEIDYKQGRNGQYVPYAQ